MIREGKKLMFEPRSILAIHEANYKKSFHKLQKQDHDTEMINKTIEWLQKHPIKCYRYSNKLGDKLHIPNKYNAKIQLSLDATELIIMTKKYAN